MPYRRPTDGRSSPGYLPVIMKIAVIAEHANPFAGPARVEADGQNVHVDALARGLVRRGHAVEVLVRRDGARDAPVEPVPGVTVVQVPVGQPGPVANGDLPGLMDDFGDWVEERWRRRGDPDVVHAHFWTSGLAALRAGRRRQVPVAQTFHALGSVQRRLRGAADTSPPERRGAGRGPLAAARRRPGHPALQHLQRFRPLRVDVQTGLGATDRQLEGRRLDRHAPGQVSDLRQVAAGPHPSAPRGHATHEVVDYQEPLRPCEGIGPWHFLRRRG